MAPFFLIRRPNIEKMNFIVRAFGVKFSVQIGNVVESIIFYKEKRKKKKAFTSGGVAGLQRSNAINDGIVSWTCVYGGISLQANCR